MSSRQLELEASVLYLSSIVIESLQPRALCDRLSRDGTNGVISMSVFREGIISPLFPLQNKRSRCSQSDFRPVITSTSWQSTFPDIYGLIVCDIDMHDLISSYSYLSFFLAMIDTRSSCPLRFPSESNGRQPTGAPICKRPLSKKSMTCAEPDIHRLRVFSWRLLSYVESRLLFVS